MATATFIDAVEKAKQLATISCIKRMEVSAKIDKNNLRHVRRLDLIWIDSCFGGYATNHLRRGFR